MLDEAVEGLSVRSDGRYLDGTFGRGGHSRAVLARLGEHGRLLLMDRDPAAIAAAQAEFAGDRRVSIRHANFSSLAEWDATANGLDGVLLDLGVSSPQLDEAARGFSFMAWGGAKGTRRSNVSRACLAMNCLTMRSSSEWKLITTSRPPTCSRSSASDKPSRNASSSPFTRIRSA
jgi:hypothetical protein